MAGAAMAWGVFKKPPEGKLTDNLGECFAVVLREGVDKDGEGG